MTKFSEIAHHYLGTNLQCQLTEDMDIDFDFDLDYYPQKGTIWTLSGVNDKAHLFENGKAVPFLLTRGTAWIGPDETQFKPKMRSLSKLTQPIRVEGEEPFVPIDELEALFELDHQHYWDPAQGMEGTSLTAENILEEPFFIVQQLLDWGFNCFGLPEGEFIEIED